MIAVDYEKEKRQRPRARVNWLVVFKTSQGDISGETLNLTVDGAFIRCEESLEVDQAVEMDINVPTLLRPITISAQVVHSNKCEPEGESTYYEIGVQFTDISEKNKSLLSTAVQRESGVMLMP